MSLTWTGRLVGRGWHPLQSRKARPSLRSWLGWLPSSWPWWPNLYLGDKIPLPLTPDPQSGDAMTQYRPGGGGG